MCDCVCECECVWERERETLLTKHITMVCFSFVANICSPSLGIPASLFVADWLFWHIGNILAAEKNAALFINGGRNQSMHIDLRTKICECLSSPPNIDVINKVFWDVTACCLYLTVSIIKVIWMIFLQITLSFIQDCCLSAFSYSNTVPVCVCVCVFVFHITL